MSGQGHASEQASIGSVSVEIRTVNNRGLKCNLRVSDPLSSLESKIESQIRSLIHRGSVSVTVSFRRPAGQDLPTLNSEALVSYAKTLADVNQSLAAAGRSDTAFRIDLGSLITLPGMINQPKESRVDSSLATLVADTVSQAVQNLNQMRAAEGANMARSLQTDRDLIRQHLGSVSELAPRAVDRYEKRLRAKIEKILAEHELESQPTDLLREVQIYADRADISEEITRLSSHLDLFSDVLAGDCSVGEKPEHDKPEPTGRKLDFITQEMFRETNTIGSKAADAEISSHVVEIKCAIERIRELVQNLE